MKLHFLGAAHEVTGSCTLLTTKNHRILIDCGMEQGADMYENPDLPLPAGDIDAVLLTHAHIDHSGRIPMLVAQGFKGPIYTTAATAALCKIMLMDSAHIQEFEAEWRNRKGARKGAEPYVPLYTSEDVSRTLPLLNPCSYDKDYALFEDVSVRFTDAGHLLGSASISITVTEDGKSETVLFSGDLGNVTRPLIRDPQTPPAADYVVIESTYGDRLHGERPDYITQLTRILQETFDRGGNVVIPCFAVGRTQEMLYLLRQIKRDGLITGHDSFPVWVDSPLAVEATNIYSGDLTDYYDEETLAILSKRENPIRLPNLNLSITSDDSKAINFDHTPKVILSASGMCEAGRIRHHLKHNLWRPESTILFVGYQSEGTIGRRLIDGAPMVKLFGEEIQVQAHIETLNGISGHADRDLMLAWLSRLPEKPKTVFVNHGSDTVCDHFAATIKEALNVETVAPYNDALYDLQTGACLQPGFTARLAGKKKHYADGETPMFRRLLEAGRRLMSVIERNRGGTNKDLARFAGQVQSLADKWDR